ncbi:MAG: zinc ribbon domain-containing protein [Clostridiales bacterium]|nr:zinc ribbon domain-containing protein [Clostridiales bacterium]
MYCASCGSQLNKNAHFCPSCGRALDPVESVRPAPPPGASVRAKPKRSVPAILLGLLLLAFAVSQMALGVIGARATAVVTDCERRIHVGSGQDEGNTRDPTRYEVFYRFTAADGKAYTGSVTKSFPYGIKAVQGGAPWTLAVRYLPMMPHINAPDGEMSLLPGVSLLGLAALLFALGIKSVCAF